MIKNAQQIQTTISKEPELSLEQIIVIYDTLTQELSKNNITTAKIVKNGVNKKQLDIARNLVKTKKLININSDIDILTLLSIPQVISKLKEDSLHSSINQDTISKTMHSTLVANANHLSREESFKIPSIENFKTSKLMSGVLNYIEEKGGIQKNINLNSPNIASSIFNYNKVFNALSLTLLTNSFAVVSGANTTNSTITNSNITNSTIPILSKENNNIITSATFGGLALLGIVGFILRCYNKKKIVIGYDDDLMDLEIHNNNYSEIDNNARLEINNNARLEREIDISSYALKNTFQQCIIYQNSNNERCLKYPRSQSSILSKLNTICSTPHDSASKGSKAEVTLYNALSTLYSALTRNSKMSDRCTINIPLQKCDTLPIENTIKIKGKSILSAEGGIPELELQSSNHYLALTLRKNNNGITASTNLQHTDRLTRF